MTGIGLDQRLDYRQEILGPLFDRIAAGESCALVALASTGKSRLARFAARPDVQHQYLGDLAASTLVALVDGNRLVDEAPWGLYEQLVTSLVEATTEHGWDDARQAQLIALQEEMNTSSKEQAWRAVERAVKVLCRERGTRLCFVLDEFDALYRDLPPLALNHLRSLRDVHKDTLSYVLTLRSHPARLRPSGECEAFYELFSRSIVGLGLYSQADAARVVEQQETRKKHNLREESRDRLLDLAGGHAGLIVALFDALVAAHPPSGVNWIDWALDQPAVVDECRKVWDGLMPEEQAAVATLLRGATPEPEGHGLLVLKGVLHPHAGEAGVVTSPSPHSTLFSPLFAHFVAGHSAPASCTFELDVSTREVRIGGRLVQDLTAREFDLLAYLYSRRGEVCRRDEIFYRLWPTEEYSEKVCDNALTALVAHVRQKIESVPARPRYLTTVRGVGYKLVVCPNEKKD